MKNLPQKIYLQVGFEHDEGDDFNDLETSEISWCDDRIDDTDIEYVLLAKFQELQAENKKLRDLLDLLNESRSELYNAMLYVSEHGQETISRIIKHLDQ